MPIPVPPAASAALAGVAALFALLAAVPLAVVDEPDALAGLDALVEPVSPSLHAPSNSSAVASSSVR